MYIIVDGVSELKTQKAKVRAATSRNQIHKVRRSLFFFLLPAPPAQMRGTRRLNCFILLSSAFLCFCVSLKVESGERLRFLH